MDTSFRKPMASTRSAALANVEHARRRVRMFVRMVELAEERDGKFGDITWRTRVRLLSARHTLAWCEEYAKAL